MRISNQTYPAYHVVFTGSLDQTLSFYRGVVSGSLDGVGSEGFPGADSECPWLLMLPAERSEPGNSHSCECSVETSESSNDRGMLNVADLTCFIPRDSFNGKRQTGQVDCFLSHVSMQER